MKIAGLFVLKTRNALLASALLLSLVTAPLFSSGQQLELAVGTDIPYQHYVGAAFNISKFHFAFKTGLLTDPYSGMLTESLGYFEIDNSYIDLLETSYDVGWMNTFNVCFRTGKKNPWYFGPEVRFDRLTAAEAAPEIIETITGEDLQDFLARRSDPIDAELGVDLWAVGFRLGKKIALGPGSRSSINIEFSASKYISSESTLTLNNNVPDNLDQQLQDLLWEDVFKDYGFVGGPGISYRFTIGPK